MSELDELYSHTLKLITKVDDGVIEQELIMPGIMRDINKTTIDTKEEQIRKALIFLGWTPPDE